MIPRQVISIVDDDDDLRMSLGSLVRSCGYTTHLFDCAEQFIASDVTIATDCLISDIQMPGMNGLQMYESLLARGIRMPVVFITASVDDAPRQWAARLGANGYLSKPFDGRALITCLETALKDAARPS